MSEQVDPYAPGERWVTRDGSRTIEVRSEAPSWRGDRMFLVRTVANRGTLTGRQTGDRLLSLPVLLRKYRKVIR